VRFFFVFINLEPRVESRKSLRALKPYKRALDARRGYRGAAPAALAATRCITGVPRLQENALP